MHSLARRLDVIEPQIMAQVGTLEKAVYGVIDRVDKIDGKIVPHIIRRWKGEIGAMVETTEEPSVLLIEKLEPFILKHKKYKCLYGGRVGTKTRFAQNVLATEVQSCGSKVYVLRERMTSIKESIYSGIESTIRRMGLGGYRFIPSRWMIQHNTGGRFVFGGMKNIIDMKGTSDFKRFLMEEAENTSQKTLRTLGPTLRDIEGAELWYLWNTGGSQDPMSKRFITPYKSDLDKTGFYEDDYQMIVKLTYKDNPWFEYDETSRQELENDKLNVKRKIISESEFKGVWGGEFNDDVTISIIKEDWFNSCIDAHKKLGFKAQGAVTAAADPSDVGSDPFGYSARKGVVFFDIDEIDGENGNRKMDEACSRAILAGVDSFGYDADGLGATLRDNVSRSFNGKTAHVYAYKGSTEIHHPKAQFNGESVGNQDENIKNEDVLKNKKAQNIIGLANRILRTHEAVTDPDKRYVDPDLLISFDSESIHPDMMSKLRYECCKVPRKPGPTIQFYTKDELRRGVPLPNGDRLKIASPNLFDSVVVSLDNASIISREEPIDIESISATKVNHW